MKWRVMLELVGTDGTVGVHEVGGREAVVERLWQWKQHYGAAILDQMRRLGTSVDWSREYFTMDAPRSLAVREAFVRLHEQGLIYRGAYIVNWCPRCQTALKTGSRRCTLPAAWISARRRQPRSRFRSSLRFSKC